MNTTSKDFQNTVLMNHEKLMVLLAEVIRNESQISDALTKMLTAKNDNEQARLSTEIADKEGFKQLATQMSDMLILRPILVLLYPKLLHILSEHHTSHLCMTQ